MRIDYVISEVINKDREKTEKEIKEKKNNDDKIKEKEKLDEID